MSWTNKYIGIPFVGLGRDIAGADCYGLLRLVYQQELDISLPSYTEGYACADELEQIAELLDAARTSGVWSRTTDEFKPFDVLVFRQGRHQSHVGLYVQNKTMLHMAEAEQSKLENFKQARWNNRLVGIYRHTKIAQGSTK
jgi:cell wall-associated NlpC family hydrolase